MISKYVLLMSALYLFDAAALPLSGRTITISFPLLTMLYFISVVEISVILSLFALRSHKYPFSQSR